MNDWKETILGEVSNRITKGTTPTKGHGFIEHGINYVKSDAIDYNGKIDKAKFVFINEETHNSLKRSQLQKDDIFYGRCLLGKKRTC